jgi:hypothetical protein
MLLAIQTTAKKKKLIALHRKIILSGNLHHTPTPRLFHVTAGGIAETII